MYFVLDERTMMDWMCLFLICSVALLNRISVLQSLVVWCDIIQIWDAYAAVNQPGLEDH